MTGIKRLSIVDKLAFLVTRVDQGLNDRFYCFLIGIED